MPMKFQGTLWQNFVLKKNKVFAILGLSMHMAVWALLNAAPWDYMPTEFQGPWRSSAPSVPVPQNIVYMFGLSLYHTWVCQLLLDAAPWVSPTVCSLPPKFHLFRWDGFRVIPQKLCWTSPCSQGSPKPRVNKGPHQVSHWDAFLKITEKEEKKEK